MFTASGTSHRKRTSSARKHGVSRTSAHNEPSKTIEEVVASRIEPNYGNKLLSLRAALNEKELQLVELREQHISVVNRAAIARKNWEDAIKSKDQVIVQLQKALHVKKCELDRQERVNEENVQRLLQQRQEEKNTELEQKERKISHLEAKNSQFVQELVDQQKTITKLKKQTEDRERLCASHLHKINVINGRVQDLKAALQKKEEVVETQQKYCQELKALLWKRDSVIGQLQLAEQQLQSSLARQEADYEALECARQKLQEEKEIAEKNLTELRQSFDNRDVSSLHIKCEKRLENRKEIKRGVKSGPQSPILTDISHNLKEKESTLRKQKRQIQEVGRCLEAAEIALDAKRRDYQYLMEENQRLVEKYDSLKQDFEAAQQRQRQLESNLESLQERLVNAEMVMSEAEQAAIAEAAQYAPSPERSFPMDPAGEHLMDDFSELERQSNPSVVGRAHNSGTLPTEPKQRCKTRAPYEVSHPTAASLVRNLSSSTRRATRERYKAPSVRNTLVSEVLDAFEKKHPLSVDHNKGLPKNRTYHETAQATKNCHDRPNDSVKKAERKAWSLTDGTKRYITPTGAMGNGRHINNVVVDLELKSHSSESSRSSSPSKQEMDSSQISEIDPHTTEERSPTLVEAFQNSSICSQKKTPIYSYISRKSTSAQLHPSPSSTDDSRTPSPTDRRSAISVTANESKAAVLANGWTMREFPPYEAQRTVPEGEMARSRGNKRRTSPTLRVPKDHESPAPYVEHEKMTRSNTGRDCQGKTVRQEMNESNTTSGTVRNVSHSAGKRLPTATKPPASKTPRTKDSPTPPSDHFEGTSEMALKSLQDEVTKRERGWRRTEANMRAALCQRLAELNGANHSIRGEDMIEMVERARFESKRSVQRRKT